MLKDEHHGRHHKLVKVEICVDAFALVVALIQLGTEFTSSGDAKACCVRVFRVGLSFRP